MTAATATRATTTMTSLSSSIFGESSSKDNSSGVASLFDGSVKLPSKPSHTAVPTRISPPEGKKKQQQQQRQEQKKQQRADPKESASGKEKKGPKISSNDDAEDRTVFVGNLPPSTSRKALAALFRDCGKVESSRLRSLATTGVKVSEDRAGDQNFVRKVCANTKLIDEKAMVQGYVVFADAASVEAALKKNNERVGDGFMIRVDRAKPTLDASRSVFVGNLPYHAQETTLRQHFCEGCQLDSETDVENVRIVRDRDTKQCKGFGYVLFREKSMVTTALQRMDGTEYLRRSLRVSVCGKRFKSRGSGQQQQEQQHDGPTPRRNDNKKKKAMKDATGALKRIMAKEEKSKKRKRGEPKKTKTGGTNNGGVSRRAAAEAKVEKRYKKLKRRMSRGMGKNKASA